MCKKYRRHWDPRDTAVELSLLVSLIVCVPMGKKHKPPVSMTHRPHNYLPVLRAVHKEKYKQQLADMFSLILAAYQSTHGSSG